MGIDDSSAGRLESTGFCSYGWFSGFDFFGGDPTHGDGVVDGVGVYAVESFELGFVLGEEQFSWGEVVSMIVFSLN